MVTGEYVAIPPSQGHLSLPPIMRASQGYPMPPVTPPSDAKVSFFDNLLKKFDSGSISQKKYLVFCTYA